MRFIKVSKAIYKGMKEFSQIITTIVNSILLSAVYILGIGLTSVVAKVMKKDFMNLKKKSDTYWTDLNLKKRPFEKYLRQF